MILGISTEGAIFVYAGIAGATVWCAYYMLICIRKLLKHSNLAAGIEDIFFWIAASIYIFRKMYETTYGSVRWFFVLGTLCGAGAGCLFFRLFCQIFAKVKKRLEKYKKNR